MCGVVLCCDVNAAQLLSFLLIRPENLWLNHICLVCVQRKKLLPCSLFYTVIRRHTTDFVQQQQQNFGCVGKIIWIFNDINKFNTPGSKPAEEYNQVFLSSNQNPLCPVSTITCQCVCVRCFSLSFRSVYFYFHSGKNSLFFRSLRSQQNYFDLCAQLLENIPVGV